MYSDVKEIGANLQCAGDVSECSLSSDLCHVGCACLAGQNIIMKICFFVFGEIAWGSAQDLPPCVYCAHVFHFPFQSPCFNFCCNRYCIRFHEAYSANIWCYFQQIRIPGLISTGKMVRSYSPFGASSGLQICTEWLPHIGFCAKLYGAAVMGFQMVWSNSFCCIFSDADRIRCSGESEVTIQARDAWNLFARLMKVTEDYNLVSPCLKSPANAAWVVFLLGFIMICPWCLEESLDSSIIQKRNLDRHI